MKPLRRLLVAYVVAAAGLVAGKTAVAGPCPAVMVILDRSGSMDSDPSGGSSTPSKMDIAKTTLGKLFMEYGDQLPFGYTSFASTGATCDIGVDILVKPAHGTKADVTAALNATMTEGSTNTGPAIDAVMALPEMNDSSRPGSYILLVTDGEPNCAGNVGPETTDPEYTIGAIKRAAKKGIQTFVIGFGALPTADKDAMNMMAIAGGVPCMGASCNGQQFYAAEDDAGLQAAIDSISSTIVGEFGGACDDSCYANGCPNAGEICVAGHCKLDPCLNVRNTCAPTDYCYTDGNSPGTCTPVCPLTCPAGQSCTLAGCAPDPCAGVLCDSNSYCKNGVCVASMCTSCDPGLYCIDGQCKDDPCRYVQCPQGSMCQALKGTCTGGNTSDGTNHARSSGCHFAPGQYADQAVLFFGLAAVAAALVTARRRRA